MDAAVVEKPEAVSGLETPAARTVSAAFADFTLGLSLDAVPAELVRKAKGHMLDGLGIALASTGFDYAGPTLEGARKLGSGTEAHALGTGAPLPPAGAALVNGVLIHGLDFDDTHIGAIYHATAPALASALAAGEAAGVSGRELLTGYIAGLEIGCRLGLAAGGGFHDRHFHPTALCGAFAATYVAGRLTGVDAATLVSASGLCGSMAAGVLELQGSWLKRMHPGWAAHSGVAAVALASSGFVGPTTMFEGPRGFYQTHLGRIPTGESSPVHRLGQDWSIGGIALKPYPCCHFIHGFVDCALALRPKVELDEIERIDCPIHKRIQPMVGGPQRPSEPYAAMFSVPYTVALALVTGQVDLAAFHDRGVHDPQVLATLGAHLLLRRSGKRLPRPLPRRGPHHPEERRGGLPPRRHQLRHARAAAQPRRHRSQVPGQRHPRDAAGRGGGAHARRVGHRAAGPRFRAGAPLRGPWMRRRARTALDGLATGSFLEVRADRRASISS